MFKVGTTKKFLFAAAIAALSMGAAQAKAGSVIFSNFLQTNPNDTPWTFTDAGSSSTFNIVGSESVLFVSTGGVNQMLTFSGTAAATLTSTATGTAVVSGTSVSQGIAGELKFSSGSTNVLTVDFTGAITGTLGSQSTSFNGDSQVTLQAVSFTSDYMAPGISFAPNFTFSIALTQLPSLALANDGYLANFNSSATGNFSANPGSGATPTPLPASIWGGLGMMSALGGTGLIRRRRRLSQI